MALQVKNLARLTEMQKQAVRERAAAIRQGEVGVDAAVDARVDVGVDPHG
jgi:hypothetical protein